MSAAADARRNADRIVGGKVNRLGRAVGFELLGRLVRATPVDTGRARGNWNASVGAEDDATDDGRRAPQALAEGAQRIARLKLWEGDTLLLTNGLPYIGPLNDGTSQQAPAGFVQLTTLGMRRFVESAGAQEGRRE